MYTTCLSFHSVAWLVEHYVNYYTMNITLMYIHSTYSSTVSKLLLYQRSRSASVSSTVAWLPTVGWATSAVTT